MLKLKHEARQVHVLLGWFRLWRQSVCERERKQQDGSVLWVKMTEWSVQSLSHLHRICIVTVAFRNSISLPAILFKILHNSLNLYGNGRSKIFSWAILVYLCDWKSLCDFMILGNGFSYKRKKKPPKKDQRILAFLWVCRGSRLCFCNRTYRFFSLCYGLLHASVVW